MNFYGSGETRSSETEPAVHNVDECAAYCAENTLNHGCVAFTYEDSPNSCRLCRSVGVSFNDEWIGVMSSGLGRHHYALRLSYSGYSYTIRI